MSICGPLGSNSHTNMLEAWREAALFLMHTPPQFRQSSRKLFRNLNMIVPGHYLSPDEESITLESTGYSAAKLKQLKWHYLNQPTIDRCKFDVNQKLDGNKIGSGTFDFRGNVKKHVKADYCLVGSVVTVVKGQLEMDIFYRSTEFTKRFLGDLLFFKEVIIPQFDMAPIRHINFHFTNLTWHPMFAMFLMSHTPNWKQQLELCRQIPNDPPAWQAVVRHNARVFENLGEDQRFNVLRRIQKYVRKRKDDPFLIEFGKYVVANKDKAP